MPNPLSFAAGDSRVHRIVELTGPVMGIRQMLPGLSEEMLAEHRGWLTTVLLRLCMAAIVHCASARRIGWRRKRSATEGTS